MDEPFTKVVSQIFNNWTALRLAVEHSMGGPNSKQSALDFMNYMVQYCLYEQNVDVEGIQDALEDILDEEFETVCEDDSTKEIAQILFKFLTLLKEGNTQQCEEEFQKLPTINTEWLTQNTQNLQNPNVQDSSDDSEDDEGNSMDQGTSSTDPDGWTEVKTRRKR